MNTKTPQGEYSGLGYYIREVLFKEFKDSRRPLELKWEKNLNAFRSIGEGTWKKKEGEDWRSNTFIQVTKQKIVSAYAMVIDMLLQGGKIPFALVPSPLDDIQMEDLPDEQRENLEDDIDDMTGIINQQLQDCFADRELMKNVFSGAIYGETYAENYVHTVRRTGFEKVEMAPPGTPNPEQYTRYEKFVTEKDSPAYKYNSVWSIFRDLESDDIQSGSGILKRELLSSYELRELIGKPFYIEKNIESAIKHAAEPGGTQHGGEDDAKLPPILRDVEHRRKTIEVLRFWGRVPLLLAKDFEKSGDSFDLVSEFEHDGREVEVMITMADTEIIQYAINDMGKRPFHRVVWEDNLDQSSGTGVADNVQDAQQVINGMVRAFEDNVKLIANVILAVKKRYIAPGALKNGIYPGLELEIAEECEDARKAVQQVIVQDVTGSLLNGIPLFERYADESSQMPKIMQGVVAEKQKPDTLGEINILQQNAGKYLGSVIKNFDEGLIEPVTKEFYEYNMEDPEITKGKGNFITSGLGFSSFQDRAVRLQKIMQGLNLVLSSEILTAEIKPREILLDLWKGLDLDPTTIFKTSDEKKQEQQQDMESRAQEEARVRQIQSEMQKEEAQTEIIKEDAKHAMDLEGQEAEHENDMESADQKFEHDLVLKAVSTKT